MVHQFIGTDKAPIALPPGKTWRWLHPDKEQALRIQALAAHHRQEIPRNELEVTQAPSEISVENLTSREQIFVLCVAWRRCTALQLPRDVGSIKSA